MREGLEVGKVNPIAMSNNDNAITMNNNDNARQCHTVIIRLLQNKYAKKVEKIETASANTMMYLGILQ